MEEGAIEVLGATALPVPLELQPKRKHYVVGEDYMGQETLIEGDFTPEVTPMPTPAPTPTVTPVQSP